MDRQTPFLVLCILGLASLALFLQFLPAHPVSSLNDLASLQINQKVVTTSAVATERSFPDNRYLSLANGLEARCFCPSLPPLKSKHISITGTLQRYRNQTWIEVHTLALQISP